MATSLNFKNKQVLIVGLGRYAQGSGISAVKYFVAAGARVRVVDGKTADDLAEAVARLPKNVERYLGTDRDSIFLDDVDLVFQNPAVPDTHPLIVIAGARGIPVVNDWSLFFMHPKAQCIGVTGTRGKTTTTTMLFQMIKKVHKNARLAGNIGVSPLTFLQKYNGEMVVAEFSSWLLRGLRVVKKSPSVAVVTNLMNDHQNMYSSMTQYRLDKEEIFVYQKKSDHVILNLDNEVTCAMVEYVPSKVWAVGKDIGTAKRGVIIGVQSLIVRGTDGGELFYRDFKITGEHNYYNAAFATCAALAAGVPMTVITKVLATFRGVPYRLELRKTVRGTSWYNDTTATTPDAGIAALKTFAGKKITLIAGGADKMLEYDEWARVVKGSKARVILMPGSATDKMVEALCHEQVKYTLVKDLRAAIALARKLPREIVLFSPAAASFNQFKNEFDRGDQFNARIGS